MLSTELPENIDPIYLKKLPNGLYPGEVVLVDWINGKSVDSVFPGYFHYTYGIDASKSLKKLIKEGFLREATIRESLPSLKVNQLKEILKANNLKVSGTKKELINRVIDNLSPDKYKEHIKNPTIKATDKGNEILNEFYYIVPAHKNGSKEGIYNPATVIRYMKNRSTPSNNDISWALYIEAFERYQIRGSYGLLTVVMRNMASQLYKEKKYRESLKYYLQIFIVDTSGLNNGSYISTPEYIHPNPNLGQNVLRLMNIIEIDENQLRKEFSTAWNKIIRTLPFHYLEEETSFQCLLAAIDNEVDYIKETITNAYRHVDKELLEKEFNLRFNEFSTMDTNNLANTDNKNKTEVSSGCLTQIILIISLLSCLGLTITIIV